MATFDLQFEPDHAAASEARHEARHLLAQARVPPLVVSDLELIMSELISNAVEQQPKLPVRLAVSITHYAVHLTVTNSTNGSTGVSTALIEAIGNGPGHDPLAERGRGLAIVKALAADLQIVGDREWTSIKCLVRFDRSST